MIRSLIQRNFLEAVSCTCTGAQWLKGQNFIFIIERKWIRYIMYIFIHICKHKMLKLSFMLETQYQLKNKARSENYVNKFQKNEIIHTGFI